MQLPGSKFHDRVGGGEQQGDTETNIPGWLCEEQETTTHTLIIRPLMTPRLPQLDSYHSCQVPLAAILIEERRRRKLVRGTY